MLWVTAPDAPALVQDIVVAIDRVDAAGRFNPYINEGAHQRRAIVVVNLGCWVDIRQMPDTKTPRAGQSHAVPSDGLPASTSSVGLAGRMLLHVGPPQAYLGRRMCPHDISASCRVHGCWAAC